MQGRRKAKSKKSTRTFCVDGSSLPSLASFSAGFCKTGAAGLAPIQGKEGAKVVVGGKDRTKRKQAPDASSHNSREDGGHTLHRQVMMIFCLKKTRPTWRWCGRERWSLQVWRRRMKRRCTRRPRRRRGTLHCVCVCVCVCV